jgi:energy-coupling factor transporter ATP-binding protein EcfA2
MRDNSSTTGYRILGTPASREAVDNVRLAGALIVAGLFGLHNCKLNALVSRTDAKEPTLEDDYSSWLTTAPLMTIVKEQQKYPHIAIVGKTGDGKSTLAQFLTIAMEGKRYVADPHYSRHSDDWKACDGVFCGGRNFGTADDEAVEYQAIVSGAYESPSFYQCLQAINSEMDKRYKSDLPYADNEMQTWICDETTTSAGYLKTDFRDSIKPVLFEARKVGLRLVIICQSDQVKTLHLQGEGAVREQFTYIYLGEAAVKRLRSLKQTKLLNKLKRLPKNVRWCVVGNEVSLVPEYSQMQSLISKVEKAERVIGELPTPTLVLPDASAFYKGAKREPSDRELQQYALYISRHEGEKKKETLASWGFPESGRGYQVGSSIYDKALTHTPDSP